MTSNPEEHANPPAAASVRQPKATKSAHVAPHRRRVARQAKVAKEGQLNRTAAQTPKGRQTGQARRRCLRGQQGSQCPGVAEAVRRRFAERANESHGLVGAFCPWIPERNCCQAYGSRSRVAKSEDRERLYCLKG